MTKAEDIIQEVERMKRQGKTTEEICLAVDKIIFEWNRETLAGLRLEKVMEGVKA